MRVDCEAFRCPAGREAIDTAREPLDGASAASWFSMKSRSSPSAGEGRSHVGVRTVVEPFLHRERPSQERIGRLPRARRVPGLALIMLSVAASVSG